MFSKVFFKDASERALATFAQAFLAAVGTDALSLLNTGPVDAIKIAIAAAILSVVKSVAAVKAPFGDSSASLVDLGK